VLKRTQVTPFTRSEDGRITIAYLYDSDGRVVVFLERLLRLTRRLVGRPRRTVIEALRRQERRVRDVRRLAGVSKTVLDACSFCVPAGGERAAELRESVFRARGQLWPPLPGDTRAPYDAAAAELGMDAGEIARLLYADTPSEWILARAPSLDGPALLARYNLELARAVLYDAEHITLTARGGWRGIFRAIKLARLMYRVEPAGRARRSYRVELTGPAAPFLTRPQRYGVRFARVVPALTRAPGWKLEATIVRDGRRLEYSLDASAPLPRPRKRTRFDSHFERALARDFAERIGTERNGWRLMREETPVPAGGELFLPDFTARHADGREALIEIVGFWTSEYLEAKLRKLDSARLGNLVLVVYEGLAAGRSAPDRASIEQVAGGRVVWFKQKPRIAPVMEMVERVAVRSKGRSDRRVDGG
jgi:uncharacterized protein